MNKRSFALAGLLVLAACAQDQQQISAVTLTSELTTPVDVMLHWRPSPQGTAGQVVEYSHSADGEYTILQFTSPTQSTYHHSDLVPETVFHYRIRPYVGTESAAVDITLPPGNELPVDDAHEWALAKQTGGGTRPVSSPEAAPTDFRGEAKHASGILFTWKDNAANEDGYLIEVKPAKAAEYRVAAQLDADVTSFGLITLQDEKNASYRVRPFRLGAQSTPTSQKTGRAPT